MKPSRFPSFSMHAVYISIALAAFGYLIASLWAGWQDILDAMGLVGTALLLGLLLLSLVNYCLRFVRWSFYLSVLKYSVPWKENLKIYFAGFALTTTPGKMGEMFRSAMLLPHNIPVPASLAVFFAERASDLLAILAIASIGVWDHSFARLVVGGTFLFVFVTLLLVQWEGLILNIASWAQRKNHRWAKGIVSLCGIVLHFKRCFSLPALSIGFILGVIAWFAEALGFWWLLSALGFSLPLSTAIFIYAFAMLIGGLSFLPGGLGSSEATMIGLLLFYGAPNALAITATLICRIATLWFAVALGGIFIANSNVRRRI